VVLSCLLLTSPAGTGWAPPGIISIRFSRNREEGLPLRMTGQLQSKSCDALDCFGALTNIMLINYVIRDHCTKNFVLQAQCMGVHV
jgi:hypothetical protein